MKTIFISLITLSLAFSSLVAQEPASKKLRFGLRVAGTPTWLRSDDTKKYDKSGTKFGSGFGLVMEYKLTDVVSFATGIGGEFLGGGQSYKTDIGYATDKDNNFKEVSDKWRTDSTNTLYYQLVSRKVSTTYVTIPVALKMMTTEISGFKYFGVFGGNIGILTKVRAEDAVKDRQSLMASKTNTDMNISKECIPVKVDLNIGAGAEYRLSGSTSVFVSFNYIRALTNLYKSTSKYSVSDFTTLMATPTNKPTAAKQGAFADGFQINFGILF